MWSGGRQRIATRLALTPFRPKQGILCDHSVISHMPSGCGDVRGISPQGLVCHAVSPVLLVSCLRNNECTNFCIAFDFLFFLERGEVYVGEGKPLMKWIHSKSQGKTSGWFFIIHKNVAKTTLSLSCIPMEESQLLDGTFVLGVTKDIASPWWERWEMHPVPPEKLWTLAYNKMISLFFLILRCCDAVQTSVFSVRHFQRKVICQIILVQFW